jgi:hypothetical protein
MTSKARASAILSGDEMENKLNIKGKMKAVTKGSASREWGI